jgi:NADP-dependent 3-hydroxy acid dehydrogenase YdfG
MGRINTLKGTELNNNIAGKVIVITGASSGLGGAEEIQFIVSG